MNMTRTCYSFDRRDIHKIILALLGEHGSKISTCERKICRQPAANSRSDPHRLNSITQSNTFPEDPRGKRRPPFHIHLYTSLSAAGYSL